MVGFGVRVMKRVYLTSRLQILNSSCPHREPEDPWLSPLKGDPMCVLPRRVTVPLVLLSL